MSGNTGHAGRTEDAARGAESAVATQQCRSHVAM